MMLMEEATLFLQWVEDHLKTLLVAHVTGKDHVQVDFLSCYQVDSAESVLDDSGHSAMLDLMAEVDSTKAGHFFIRRSERMSEGHEVLVQPWPLKGLLYMFLPWSLIGKVLHRRERDTRAG